jgi:hypothetical protein
MAKKYISLADASGILGISEDQLKQFRAKGDIRGFADRGNWKFRQEDVEEFGRSRQVDSGADLPLLDDPGGNALSDDDAIAEQPTIIRKGDDNVLVDSSLELEDPASDSGVRMVLDENITGQTDGSDAEIALSFGDSDKELVLEGSSGDLSDEGLSKEIPLSFGDSSHEFGIELGSDDSESIEVPLLGDSDSDVRLADSDSDVRLADSDSDITLSDSDSDVQLSDSDSDVQLADDGSTSPQLHETEGMIELPASDSDVRLTPAGDGDDGSEILLTGQDSDSDVRLLGETAPMVLGASSDSDVRLIKPDSDSDVRLLVSDSDSDVRLLAGDSPQPGSDSDVSVAGTQDAIQLPDEYDEGESILDIDDDSGLALAADSGIALSSDSGIILETSADSGISLDAAMDSGISLDAADDSGIALDIDTDSDISLAMDVDDDESMTLDTDSGISLDADSGLTLDAGDSGISLDAGGDSGISLDAGDSGISLDAGGDSDISLDVDGLEATAPAMQLPGGDNSDNSTADTLIQMPSFGDDDDDDDESDFELGALEGESSSDTSVLLFDDEDDADDRAATLIKKSSDDDEETFDLDAEEGFDEEFEDDEDDLLGEDDEIEDFDEDDFDDEEFMADEDDFDESFSTGESQAEFVGQSGVQGGAVMVAEQDWGGLTFAAVLVASVAMLVCGGVMFDLVRYIWQSGDPGVVAGPMIDMVGIK